MKIYEYPSQGAEKKVASIIDRGIAFTEKDFELVKQILDNVKKNGDSAVVDYTRRFDAPAMTKESLKVSSEEMEKANSLMDKDFMASMEKAAGRIKSFHTPMVPRSGIDTKREGVILGQLVNPVERAGVYVPGGKSGKTPLVSSVLMGVIPAKIAGVKEVIVITPPSRDGSVNPHLLAAAYKTGADAVFKAGGPWGIGALAYGTKSIPSVDVIVGPGNIYVTIAKKIVSGKVGIDMLAGPSEVLIVADEYANPEFVAADLLSQAEHDAMASAVLVTDSKELAESAVEALSRQIEDILRKDIAKESIKNFGAAMVVKSIHEGIKLANRFAPEHLELMVKEPFLYIGKIKNAGAVFLGEYTPEPVGDYIAGPNHVLPTAGTARFSSALSVENFIKKTSLISYDKKAFAKDAPHIVRLAQVEGLGAHAGSVEVRLKA